MLSRPLTLLIVLLLTAYFGWIAIGFVPDTATRMVEGRQLARIDYMVFHGAGEVIADGHGAILYQPDELRRVYGRNVFGPSGPYIFPPGLGLIFVPFSQLSVAAGYAVYSALSLVLFLGVVCLLAWRATRSYVVVGLVLLAIAAYRPFNIALVVGQPSLPLAAMLGLALVAIPSGRPALGAALIASLAVKPQFTILPTLMLLFRRTAPGAWAPYIGTGAALVLAPFLILGPGALPDFVDLLRLESENDFSFRGGARLLYSWAGFLAWLTRSDVQALPLIALLVVTAIPAAAALMKDDLPLAMAAALLGSYLIFHSLIYDWAMVVPALVVLALRPAPLSVRLPIVGFILLLHVASSAGIPAWGRYSPQFWTPLAGYVLLLWLAFGEQIVAALERVLRPSTGSGAEPADLPVEAPAR